MTDGPDQSSFANVFDWTNISLADEVWSTAALGKLDRSLDWTDRDTALALCKQHFGARGVTAKKDGGHRSLILWEIALLLWWAWAAEDEDFVMEVLRYVNSLFPEAKDEDILFKKMSEAKRRTVVDGEREPQQNGHYGWCREPSNSSSKSAIKHRAKRLRASQDPVKAQLGEELQHMLKGDAITGDPMTYRSAVERCARELARAYPRERPERLAEYFKESLAAMGAAVKSSKAVTTVETIETWVAETQAEEKERKVANAQKRDDKIRQSILFATNSKRDSKYTPEEIEAWSADNGVGLHPKSWILNNGGSYFVHLNGTWAGPYTVREFDSQGYTDLAAAEPFVQTRVLNEKTGKTSIVKLDALVQQYGCKCETKIQFSCERAWFDVANKTLMMAGPAKNDLGPRFHPEVDEWLRMMTGRESPVDEKTRLEEAASDRAWRPIVKDTAKLAAAVDALPAPPKSGLMGRFAKKLTPAAPKEPCAVDWSGPEAEDNYDTICNWLACLIQLDHTCVALYLSGEKGLGKGLFADGIAKIWKKGKLSIKAGLSHFNSGLGDSPYIHHDEGDDGANEINVPNLLRRELAAYTHECTKKRQDTVQVHGCIRMLFTANDLDMLSGGTKVVNKAGMDAIADRFAHIRVNPAGGEYLRSLGQRHRDFVDKNMLAEHALWLNEKRWFAIKSRNLRFLIEGKNTNVSDAMSTGNEVTSDVCTAIVAVIVEQQKVPWLEVRNGELSITARGLHVALQQPPWSLRVKETDVAKSLASISVNGKSKKIRVRGNTRATKNVWVLRKPALQTWCENTSAGVWEDVQAGIEKLNTVEVEE